MKKKLIAVLLAGALAFALAVPALAALETEFTATTALTNAGTVSVTVPASSGDLFINVPGAPYTVADTTAGSYSIKGGDAIAKRVFSSPGVIVNTGETPLAVTVTVTSTPSANVEFAATASGDDKIAIVDPKLAVGAAAVSGTTVTPTWTGAQEIGLTAGACTDASVTAQLPKAGKDNMGASVPGALVYRVTGDLDFGADVSTWGASDTLTMKVVFTLTPAS